MSKQDDIKDYIRKAIKKGYSAEKIMTRLEQFDYSKRDINKALEDFKTGKYIEMQSPYKKILMPVIAIVVLLVIGIIMLILLTPVASKDKLKTPFETLVKECDKVELKALELEDERKICMIDEENVQLMLENKNDFDIDGIKIFFYGENDTMTTDIEEKIKADNIFVKIIEYNASIYGGIKRIEIIPVLDQKSCIENPLILLGIERC